MSKNKSSPGVRGDYKKMRRPCRHRHPIVMRQFTTKGISEWFVLNAYALLLDALALGAALSICTIVKKSGFHGIRHLFALASLSILALILVCNAARLHSTYRDKRRFLRILLKKNETGLNPDSFKDAFGAPCTRLIARFVLFRTGNGEAYPQLCKRFGIRGMKDRDFGTVKIFATHKEALEWLSTRNS